MKHLPFKLDIQLLHDMRVATGGGHWGARPPLLRLVPPR